MRSMGLSDGEFLSLDDNPSCIGVIQIMVGFNSVMRHNYCIEIENESVYDY
jgi:hypothetical protein